MARLAGLLVAAAGCGGRGNLGTFDGTDAGAGTTDALEPIDCAPFARFGAAPLLTSRRTSQAVFSPARAHVALVTDVGASGAGDLVVVSLPAGEERVIAGGVAGVSWLGARRLLAVIPEASYYAPYRLQPYGLDGSPGVLGPTGACRHWATPDGRRLYVLAGCTDEQTGTLSVVEVETGASSQLAREVYSSPASVAVSPDGRWAAFVSGVQRYDRGCVAYTGDLEIVGATGSRTAVASNVSFGSVVALSAGRFLFSRNDCPASTTSQWVVAADGGGAIQVGSGQSYEPGSVSPDGRTLLAERYAVSGPMDSVPLFAVALDGSGALLLAEDLFPAFMTEMMFTPHAFSHDGSFAIYVSRAAGSTAMDTGLRAVRTAGGPPATIAAAVPLGAYAVSPRHDEVAYVDADEKRVMLASLVTDAATVLGQSPGDLSYPALRFVPDGRGVLAAEGWLGPLRYYPRTGGEATVMARWNEAPRLRSSNSGYELDPGGCAILYDSDYPAPGTYLTPIP